MHRSEPARAHTPVVRSKVAVFLLAGVIACAAPPVLGDVYKCAGRDGPVYQEAPCPPGRALRDFQQDPPTVSVIPIAPPPGSSRSAVAKPAGKSKTAERAKKPPVEGNPAERRHLKPGMSDGEVIARVGPPDLTSGGRNRKQARWTYMPVAGDPDTITTVLLDTGRVIEVERTVVKR